MTTPTAGDVLQASLDHLETHGWTKHQMFDPETSGGCAWALLGIGAQVGFKKVRLVGYNELSALREAKGTLALSFLTDALDLPHSDSSLVQWNDAKGRQKRHVVSAFKKAIKAARAQE